MDYDLLKKANEIEIKFQKAKNLYNSSNYLESIMFFNEVINFEGSRMDYRERLLFESLLYCSRSYCREKDYENACGIYEKYYNTLKDSGKSIKINVLLEIGQTFLKSGNEGGKFYFVKVIENCPCEKQENNGKYGSCENCIEAIIGLTKDKLLELSELYDDDEEGYDKCETWECYNMINITCENEERKKGLNLKSIKLIKNRCRLILWLIKKEEKLELIKKAYKDLKKMFQFLGRKNKNLSGFKWILKNLINICVIIFKKMEKKNNEIEKIKNKLEKREDMMNEIEKLNNENIHERKYYNKLLENEKGEVERLRKKNKELTILNDQYCQDLFFPKHEIDKKLIEKKLDRFQSYNKEFNNYENKIKLLNIQKNFKDNINDSNRGKLYSYLKKINDLEDLELTSKLKIKELKQKNEILEQRNDIFHNEIDENSKLRIQLEEYKKREDVYKKKILLSEVKKKDIVKNGNSKTYTKDVEKTINKLKDQFEEKIEEITKLKEENKSKENLIKKLSKSLKPEEQVLFQQGNKNIFNIYGPEQYLSRKRKLKSSESSCTKKRKLNNELNNKLQENKLKINLV